MIEKKKYVLIVDDVSFNRKLIAKLLLDNGCEVAEAETGEVAIDKAKNESFDMILMDVNLPGVDGLQATRSIRSDSKSSAARIVGISAHASARDRQAFLKSGMDECLPKPIDHNALLRTLSDSYWIEVIGESDRPQLDEEILDVEAALKRIGSNRELYLRFVSLFCEDMEPLSEEGANAFQQQDLLALGRFAHRVRGMSANLGANRVTFTALELEDACKSGGSKDSTVKYKQLMNQVELLYAELRRRDLMPK